MTLAEIADQLTERNIVFAIAGARHHLRRQLDRFGITAKIGPNRYYDDVQTARQAFHAA
jgi:hypothetical protein